MTLVIEWKANHHRLIAQVPYCFRTKRQYNFYKLKKLIHSYASTEQTKRTEAYQGLFS